MSSETLNAASIAQYDHASGAAWTNPNNAIGDDAAVATHTVSVVTSDWLAGIVTDTIPDGEPITGFAARFKHLYTPDGPSASSGEISIVKNGAIVGTAKSTGAWSESTAWSSVFGGSSDLWGTSGTGTDVWGVAVWADGEKYDEFAVAAFELTIYYGSGSSTGSFMMFFVP